VPYGTPPRRPSCSSPHRLALIDLGPPHPWPWLEERGCQYRWEALSFGVLHAPLSAEEKRRHLALYADRWMIPDLIAALRWADRRAPLDTRMASLLRRLYRYGDRPALQALVLSGDCS
jgi:hypothetical protein